MKILKAPLGGLSFYFYKSTPTTQFLARINTSHITSYEYFKEAIVQLSIILNEPYLPKAATYERIMNSSLDDFTLKEIQNMLIKDIQMLDVYFYMDSTSQMNKYPSPSLQYFDPYLKEKLTEYFIRNIKI